MVSTTVPGWYPTGARCLLIGQVPGQSEAAQGRPFIGNDGQQLRRWLRLVGIDPESCAYDNIHQDYNGNPTYKPNAKETKAGVARLGPVAETFEVVVLVGGHASKLVWPGLISKVQGRQEVRGSTWYTAMWHPGYWRNAVKGRAQIEGEVLAVLKAAKARLDGVEAKPFLPECTYHAGGDQEIVPGRFDNPPIAIDVETTGETSDCRKAQFNLCAIAPQGVVFLDPPRIDPTVELIVWNEPYDRVVLGALDNPSHDGKMISHMMGEPDTTLKGQSLRYLDRLMLTYPEAERLGVLPEYCLGDAVTAYDILPVLLEVMDNSVRDLYYDLEKPLFPLWARMTSEGSFYVDHDKVETYYGDLTQRIGAARADLQLPIDRDIRLCSGCGLWAEQKEVGQKCLNDRKHKWVDEHVETYANLNAPHQVKAALEGMGIDVPDTQAETLWFFRDEPLVQGLLHLKKMVKESGMVEPLLHVPRGERIGGIWNPHGAWTMRVSCRGINLMQQPPSIWEFFLAGPGHTLLTFDHSQIELRLAAHFSHDPVMLDIFREGGLGDQHAFIMQHLGLEDRRLAKIFNFGWLYDVFETGAGFEAQARKFEVELDWKTIRNANTMMNETFPTYRQHRRRVAESIRVPGLFGMIHYVPEGEEHHRMNEAVNVPCQGGGALVTKYGMLALWRAGYEVVAQNHDAITLRVPNAYVEEARNDVPRIMEQAIPYPLDVPLLVEAK